MSVVLRQSAKNTNLRGNRSPGVRQFFYRKVKEGCECPEAPPSDKIVEEKKCGCPFTDWKPKARKQIEKEIKAEMKPKPPGRCFAGMVLSKPPPDCQLTDTDPFKKNCCNDQKKQEEKEPPKVKHAEKEIPYADWDTDCK